MSWQQGGGASTAAPGSIPYAAASIEDEILFQQLQYYQPANNNGLVTAMTSNPASLQEKILHPPTPDCPPIDPTNMDRIARDYISDLRNPNNPYMDFQASNQTVLGDIPLNTPAPTVEDLMVQQQHQQHQQYRQQRHSVPVIQTQAQPLQRNSTQNYNHNQKSYSTTNNYGNYGDNDFDFLVGDYNLMASQHQQNQQQRPPPGYQYPTGGVGMSTNTSAPTSTTLPQHQHQAQSRYRHRRPGSVPAVALSQSQPQPPTHQQHQHQQQQHLQRVAPDANHNSRTSTSRKPKDGSNSNYSRPNYGLGLSIPPEELPAPVPAKSVVKKPSKSAFIFSNSSVEDMSRHRIVKKKSSRNLRKAKKEYTNSVNNAVVKTPAKSQKTERDDDFQKSSPTTIPLDSTVQKPRQYQQQHEKPSIDTAASPTPATKGTFKSMTSSKRLDSTEPPSTPKSNITGVPQYPLNFDDTANASSTTATTTNLGSPLHLVSANPEQTLLDSFDFESFGVPGSKWEDFQ